MNFTQLEGVFMGKQLFYNGFIVTGEERTPINNGYLLVEDGFIIEVGKELPERNKMVDITEWINFEGKWVMPGLINTHGHAGSTLLRGYSDDLPLQEWLNTKIWPMESKFTKKTVKAGLNLAIVEMLKSGTTTFLEMYHLHLDTMAKIISDSKIRAVLCRGMIGLCSLKEQQKKLKLACELADYVKKVGYGKITSMLAPHAPYTCPPSFLKDICVTAKQKALPIHIHVSETRKEVEEHVNNFGLTPILHLSQIGLFESHCLIAHAVHVTDEEMKIIADKNVYISHNPTSNLKLGSGIANVPKMLLNNIKVALGTDSTASSNNLDMFQEMKMAALIHKGIHQDPTLIPSDVALTLATRNGAEALCLDNVGLLKQNYKADFITINNRGVHLQPNDHVISHLVYAATGSDVVDVYINGECVVKNKEVLTMDEERVVYEANKFFLRIK